MSPRGLVRVTVTSATRRVDLVVPGGVPVADLVPELARSVGVLDAVTAHGGLSLVNRDGRVLDPGSGLAAQGVEDGGVLAVTAGAAVEPPRLHDDVAVALAEVVEQGRRPWDADTARRTALVAAAVVLLLGAAGLVRDPRSALSLPVALGTAVVLVLAAVALSHRRAEVGVVVAVAWGGCAYAGVAGLAVGPGLPSDATWAVAGAGVVAGGLVAVLGLRSGQALLLPPVAAGAVLLATGLVADRTPYHPAALLTGVLTLAALGGVVAPRLAVAAAGLAVEVAPVLPDHAAVTAPVDLERLRADARVAHEILVGLSATVGLLLVTCTPFAVSRGPAGSAVAVLGCAVTLLGTRFHRGRTDVLVGLASGGLGLVATVVSALWLHPSWGSGAAAVLAASGVLLVAARLPARRTRAWPDRLADAAETLALLTLPSATVVATGVLTTVRG